LVRPQKMNDGFSGPLLSNPHGRTGTRKRNWTTTTKVRNSSSITDIPKFW
jgi:hypothetical protein